MQEDQSALLVEFLLPPIPEPARVTRVRKEAPPKRVPPEVLNDPANVSVFQWRVASFEWPERASPDEVVQKWSQHVQAAASAAFRVPASLPRKPWISQRGWEQLQVVKTLRAHRRQLASILLHAVVKSCFATWAGSVAKSWIRDTESQRVAQEARALENTADQSIAGACSGLTQAMRANDATLLHDRRRSFDSYVGRAALAASEGSYQNTYEINKQLSGVKLAPHPGIASKQGSLLTSQSSIDTRWREHHAAVLGAVEADGFAAHCTDGLVPDSSKLLEVDQDIISSRVDRLNGNKGIGPDGVSGHALRRGVCWLTAQLSKIVATIAAATSRVPAPWRGGRLVSLFKNKGSSLSCDNSRGILVSSHVSKILTDIIATNLNPLYETYVGVTQFGATKGGGTALASHALRTARDIAALQGKSSQPYT